MREVDVDLEAAPSAVVVGGTGEVGTGIVRALVAAGWDVVVPTRSEARAGALASAVGTGARPVVADVTTDAGVARVREALLDTPRLVVAALGSPARGGPMVSVSPEAFDRMLLDTLGPRFRVARGFAALVASRGGMYVTVNGPTALQAPAGAGAQALASAAQVALCEVLSTELPSLRVLDLVVATPLRVRGRPSRPHWLTPDEVGAVVLRAVTDPRFHSATLVVDRKLDHTGEPELAILGRIREPLVPR